MKKMGMHEFRGLMNDLVIYASDADEEGVSETLRAIHAGGLLERASVIVDELHRLVSDVGSWLPEAQTTEEKP